MSIASRQVDDFIEALPERERTIAEAVRELLFEYVPQIEEKFSFKLPFYHYYGMFCYLHFDKGGLHLCFCRGKDLVDAFPQLEQKNRAAIASVTLKEKKDIQRLELVTLITTAAEWNKEAKRLKISMVQKRAR
jgi:uncharacterized protein